MAATTIERLTFSAGDFGAYHDLYAVGTDVARTSAPFRAEVDVLRFPRMLVFSRAMSGVSHSRSPVRVRRDGFDHVTLHLLIGGRLLGGGLGDTVAVGAGEILVVDTRLPHWTRANDCRLVTVALARDRLPASLTEIPHGAVLPARRAGLLGDLIGSLVRRAAEIDVGRAESVGRAMGELLALALGGHAAEGETGRRLTRRVRAERFVEDRLADPRLDADGIAQGLGVSRSSLYRDFADEGVERFILARRLDRFREALRRPGSSDPVGEIAAACGFNSIPHATRAFRTTFGLPPGAYRAALAEFRREAVPENEGARRQLARWTSDLS